MAVRINVVIVLVLEMVCFIWYQNYLDLKSTSKMQAKMTIINPKSVKNKYNPWSNQ